MEFTVDFVPLLKESVDFFEDMRLCLEIGPLADVVAHRLIKKGKIIESFLSVAHTHTHTRTHTQNTHPITTVGAGLADFAIGGGLEQPTTMAGVFNQGDPTLAHFPNAV